MNKKFITAAVFAVITGVGALSHADSMVYDRHVWFNQEDVNRYPGYSPKEKFLNMFLAVNPRFRQPGYYCEIAGNGNNFGSGGYNGRPIYEADIQCYR